MIVSAYRKRWLQAWAAAIGILVAAQLILGACFYLQRLPEWIGVVIRSTPILAALACSVLAPQYKLISGVLVVVPAAFLGVMLNLAAQMFGARVDLPGWRGALGNLCTSASFRV
jgi:hypothetical protein